MYANTAIVLRPDTPNDNPVVHQNIPPQMSAHEDNTLWWEGVKGWVIKAQACENGGVQKQRE